MAGNEEEVDDEEGENEEQTDDGAVKNTRKQTKRGQFKRTYPYKCLKCSKRFVYKEVYEAHIRIHKGLPGFSCPHCPKTFNEKANFDYHMQDHTGIRPAKCHLCEKSFKNKQDLASHIRCHKVKMKFRCKFLFVFIVNNRHFFLSKNSLFFFPIPQGHSQVYVRCMWQTLPFTKSYDIPSLRAFRSAQLCLRPMHTTIQKSTHSTNT